MANGVSAGNENGAPAGCTFGCMVEVRPARPVPGEHARERVVGAVLAEFVVLRMDARATREGGAVVAWRRVPGACALTTDAAVPAAVAARSADALAAAAAADARAALPGLDAGAWLLRLRLWRPWR